MAATDPWLKRLRRAPPGQRQRTGHAGRVVPARCTRLLARLRQLLRGALSGLLAGGTVTQAATLPEDKAEAMVHVYDGGGVRATGPALLVRKSLADKVSLSAQLYVDAVSNASIDVITTASPFRETRRAWDLGLDALVRDTNLTLALSRSSEPDYLATSIGVDASHEVFGGMTTVSLGFTRGRDDVGRKDHSGWIDQALHWQYRAGVTQVLTPRWLVSANLEAIADSGMLGSPYRAARVFGAAVPERSPRTRSSRAVKLRSVLDTDALLSRSALRAEYRYFWDSWDIQAHTTELGLARHLGESFLLDIGLRTHRQGKALFYSDNAQTETAYVSRNRQLGTFTSDSLALRLSYALPRRAAPYELQFTGGWEYKRFRYRDFTDLRTGAAYAHDAHIVQATVTATF